MALIHIHSSKKRSPAPFLLLIIIISFILIKKRFFLSHIYRNRLFRPLYIWIFWIHYLDLWIFRIHYLDLWISWIRQCLSKVGTKYYRIGLEMLIWRVFLQFKAYLFGTLFQHPNEHWDIGKTRRSWKQRLLKSVWN